MTRDDARLERLHGMLRQRGILLPAFDLYGGAKGLYDFGPVGGRLRSRLNQVWLDHWLCLGNVVEISCPTVTPYEVLEASGHVGEFSDFMTVCRQCEEASRADTLLEAYHPNPDALSKSELQSLLDKENPDCPSCRSNDWNSIIAQNLMFSTTIGAGTSGREGFLRPETAQGMFTSFPALYRHFRERLPFGAVQVGKGYRNEISPRQGMIRLREFNMAELEYFIDPNASVEHDFSSWSDITFNLVDGDGKTHTMSLQNAVENQLVRHPTVGFFMGKTYDFLIHVGIDPSRLRFRQHASDEMAHYASDCWDVEIEGSYGWIECVGIAHRGCYDLEAHERATGKTLRARREFSEPRIIEIDGWTIDGGVAGPAFRADAGQVKTIVESFSSDIEFPIDVELSDGRTLTVLPEHVKRVQKSVKETGEWFVPHVVEPAFGIDRILWHILDHAFVETEKGGEPYRMLKLSDSIAPIDVAIFPLFEKDGMDVLASELHQRCCQMPGLVSLYDGSGSIGKRYARADEIGVPICLTVDHQSIEDRTVTLRQRNDGSQIRISVDELPFL
ncbi:MAG: glycine--tRNA ligase [Candidatus Thermoplasmatota archaeon]|nr:glycine--tRNA ligase [Candidatus Thermoplasmatota archaeon]